MQQKRFKIGTYLNLHCFDCVLNSVLVPQMVEQVSGDTVEFEMNSLVPGSHYTVGVYGVKETQKSASALTEFTTGRSRL